MTSREFATKLERRVARADVLMPSSQAVALLEAYYALLVRWNSRINLTSLALEEGPPATLDRLLVEPLAAARHIPETRILWVDLGSGGGSPAIPLKIVRPNAVLTMVEATTKKATFLKEVVRELHLAEAFVENARIEELEAHSTLPGTVQLVTARAVRLTSALFDAIRILLAPEGRLHLYANRPPEVPSSAGFSIEGVHKLGVGLETKLIELAPMARDWRAPTPAVVTPASRSGIVPRGTDARRPGSLGRSRRQHSGLPERLLTSPQRRKRR